MFPYMKNLVSFAASINESLVDCIINILGNEMGPERRTLIESSAQDLSDDNQTIGSLDIGEAIVTSNFTKFAIPIKIPLFEDLINGDKKAENEKPKIKKGSPGF